MTRFSRHSLLWLAGICIFAFQSKTAAENKVVRLAKYATEHNWSTNPSEDLSQPGNRIVSLPACPPGVTGKEWEYWVLITGPENGDSEISGSVSSGAGTPEPVKVTGGTCAGDGRPGTLQFTLMKPHAPGYSISSASGGLQEALIAARYAPTNPAGASQSGTVIDSPGEYKSFARVSIRASGITVDFSGSIVECWMDDACIFVGDPKSSTAFQDVTLIIPRGRPTVKNGQKPFIEVNAQKTRLFNVSTRIALAGGTFGSYVQVDDDEAFLLDGLDTSLGGGGVQCDATRWSMRPDPSEHRPPWAG